MPIAQNIPVAPSSVEIRQAQRAQERALREAHEAQLITEAQQRIKVIPKYHWRRDPPDARDHIYQPVQSLATSWANRFTKPGMSKIDLRIYASPIDDQGNLGSCTGNAIAGAIDLLDKKINKVERVSRLFIYYQERLLEGDIHQDNGAYIRDGIKACYTWGAPSENLWPYNVLKFAVQPTPQAYSDALTRKITSYARCTDFAAVKNAISTGHPVIVGFDVYSSFESDAVAQTGMMTYPDTQHEQLLGGHAVCLIGYDDSLNGGRFIARNSWGTGWGDKGYFYMPYQVIQNTAMSSDFWTINTVHNP